MIVFSYSNSNYSFSRFIPQFNLSNLSNLYYYLNNLLQIDKLWLDMAFNFNSLHLKTIGYCKDSATTAVHYSFTKLNGISDL